MAIAEMDLAYTPAVAAATRPLYDRVRHVIPEVEWPFHAPLVQAINRLKRERNAVILAHNYQTPEIYHCVADIVGDSLALAREATKTDADVIVLAGVHFMAETAKILNPEKTVLIPDAGAGCSLAESITAADVRLLRERYPGVPVATYVNTSAEVKAESDVCITSGNAVDVIEALPGDSVLCIPDEYLAQWVATQTRKKVIAWKGHCEVHERFTGEQLAAYRRQFHGDLIIIAHPECPPDVLAEADFVGSTAKMQGFVETQQPKRVLMVTECSMADNLEAANPAVEFVKPCNLCPHMKRITLSNILQSLTTLEPRVEVDAAVAARARRAVDRMLELSR
ncbi:quinolinate synthase NadA [Rhodocista pekingensis]|uniref:Quinolinate synthase n=1 Tax=Rhodocista pekingensis TaxID=201185 RepID=A0ABW2KS90_9PROT